MTEQVHHMIAGVVRDQGGSPIAQARVYFVSGPGSFPDIAALTDDNGAFALAAPLRGAYALECAAEGFASSRLSVDAPRDPQAVVEFRLTPLSTGS